MFSIQVDGNDTNLSFFSLPFFFYAFILLLNNRMERLN